MKDNKHKESGYSTVDYTIVAAAMIITVWAGVNYLGKSVDTLIEEVGEYQAVSVNPVEVEAQVD